MWVGTSAGVDVKLRAPRYGEERELAWKTSKLGQAEQAVQDEAEAVLALLKRHEAELLQGVLADFEASVQSRRRARQRARLRNPASASFASGADVGVEELWSRMDVDGDGEVTLDEIQALAKALGAKMKKKQLKAMFANVDKDGSGAIDREEFSIWWTACKRGGAASEEGVLAQYKSQLQAEAATRGKERVSGLARLHAEEDKALALGLAQLRAALGAAEAATGDAATEGGGGELAVILEAEAEADGGERVSVEDLEALVVTLLAAPPQRRESAAAAVVSDEAQVEEGQRGVEAAPVQQQLPSPVELAPMGLRELLQCCQALGVSVAGQRVGEGAPGAPLEDTLRGRLATRWEAEAAREAEVRTRDARRAALLPAAGWSGNIRHDQNRIGD
jgi:hypothetical protein